MYLLVYESQKISGVSLKPEKELLEIEFIVTIALN
jgi:hypothetical protein